MPHRGGHILFEQMSTLEKQYALGTDPRPLQLAFARLFDEAAQAISRAGSDLDEVLVERRLVAMRRDGESTEVAADFLADADRLKQSVFKACREAGLDQDHHGIQIVAVRLIARLDIPRG